MNERETQTIDAPSRQQTEAFVAAGYTVDERGRPLHPSGRTDLPEGKGSFWHWGPNKTADSVVITESAEPRILLIRRFDTGEWALPGGFIDPTDESTSEAARRELREETGLKLDTPSQEIYAGVVDDPRATLHAWPETTAHLFRTKTPQPVIGQDDASSARWVKLEEVGDLYASHNAIVDAAKMYIEQAPSLQEALGEHTERTVINAGHMAYDHLLLQNEHGVYFAKQHIPERFTDTRRERHSRAYLKKEAATYERLAQHGFSHIPDRIELVENTLIMDALTEENGWHWRAPEDNDHYIREVLWALESIQNVPATEYSRAVQPTNETLWREGWDDVDDEQIAVIQERVAELSSNWDTEWKELAGELATALPALREMSAKVPRKPLLYMAHNDARQSNIAWHETEGVRIVDWSWADPAPRHADATMFLVDLVKSGHDVSNYRHRINYQHLVTLMGFWLAHSTWSTRDGSTTVREQQIASAVAGYKLLNSFDNTRREEYS